jgi:hypothetical protein
MKIWRAAVACTILTAALIVAIVHPRPNAAERGGPTAHGSEAIQSRQVGLPANTGGEHGWAPVRLAGR